MCLHACQYELMYISGFGIALNTFKPQINEPLSSLPYKILMGSRDWFDFFKVNLLLCNWWHGFVVAITSIENIGKQLICDGTGFFTFPVKYQCVFFRPFKGEILEAVVTMVNKVYILFSFLAKRMCH